MVPHGPHFAQKWMATTLPELICTFNQRTGATDLSKAALRTISLNRVYELISLTVILRSMLYGLGELLEWEKMVLNFPEARV